MKAPNSASACRNGSITRWGIFFWATLLLAASACAQNVVGWGDNSLGQLNVPADATNVIAVAAGKYHSLALRLDGTVVGWGNDGSGAATVPATATNVISIAAGYSHSLALRTDGTVIAWGNNTYSQGSVPISVTNVIAIAAGFYHNLALRADGTVVAWGRNESRQCNLPTNLSNAASVAAGPARSMVLLGDGTVLSAGYYSDSFQSVQGIVALSVGGMENLALTRDGTVVARGLLSRPVPSTATNVLWVAAGTNCDLALTTDGLVIAWGNGSLTNVPASFTNIMALALGVDHCLAVRGDGITPMLLAAIAYRNRTSFGNYLPLEARAVGSQPVNYQWLADGSALGGAEGPFPQAPAGIGTDNVNYQVVVSNHYGSLTSSFAKIKVSAVNAWGSTTEGQCAVPDSATDCIAVVAGGFHALFLNADGSAGGWGKDTDHQAEMPAGETNLVALAAGGDHSLALRQDGSVIAWGRNWDGQTKVPPEATNVIAIAAGWAHSLALRADGTVLAWGNGQFGQTNISLLVSQAIAIAAGKYHSAALRADGTVATSGLEYAVPPEATNVVAIAAGYENCLALKSDGSVVAWGDNSYGQSSIPAAASNVIAIAAGYYHGLALRADGTIVGWGQGNFGLTQMPPFASDVASISAGEDFCVILGARGLPRFGPQIASVAVPAGATFVLSPEVKGGRPITFQWFHDGMPILGATNRYLLAPNFQAVDAGSYLLVAVNAAGRSTNQPVILSVDLAPVLVSHFAFYNVAVNGNLCLVPAVFGAESLSYQWQLNGTNLFDDENVTGTHAGQLCLRGSQPVQSGYYSLILSNAYGVITGMVAQISVTEVIAWGDDSVGQTEVPASATNILAVAAGGDHNLALREDGTILAWGDNSLGQGEIPDGTTNVVAIAAGLNHSVALKADGNVVVWGDNSLRQTNIPSFNTNVIAIAAGANHTVALLADQSVVAWGASSFWLGTSPTADFNTVQVVAGGNQSLWLLDDSTVFEWLLFPSVHAGLSNVIAISAGANHALALESAGEVVGWGNNSYGQISIPNFPAKALDISCGDDHSLALLADGTIIGWGANYSGQISPPVLPHIKAVATGRSHSLAIIGSAPVVKPPKLEPRSAGLAFLNGGYRIRLAQLTGQGAVVVYGSTNLLDWEPFYTNPPTRGPLEFVDPGTVGRPRQFYRASEQR